MLEIIYLHLWLLLWLLFNGGVIWGDFAEKGYAHSLKWFPWTLAGRWKERDCYVRWAKSFSYFALPLGILVYVAVFFFLLKRGSEIEKFLHTNS